MRWYQSQFGDVFREFDDFNRGNVTIIEERMPDGSIRVRIVRSDGPRRSARSRRQHASPSQEQQQQARAQAQAAFNSIFGTGPASRIFSNLFNAGFDANAGASGAYGDAQSGGGIPFGSGSLDYPLVRVSELHGELSFSVTASSHIGVLSHRVLNGDQGDVLTC